MPDRPSPMRAYEKGFCLLAVAPRTVLTSVVRKKARYCQRVLTVTCHENPADPKFVEVLWRVFQERSRID